jgi:ATP-dependent helicase HrpB
VLSGYPDRVARRRAAASDRFVLASGTGARLARESGVVNPELIVAVEVTTSGMPGSESLIRLATGIEHEWIEPTGIEIRHRFDSTRGDVRATRAEMYDALVISEHPVTPDPIEAAQIVAQEYIRRGPTESDAVLMRRLSFAGVPVDFPDLVSAAAAGRTRLADVSIADALPAESTRALARHAPAAIPVPSGREVTLDYRDGGLVVAAVKLQELFGLADTPRIGPARVPVTFELLSPAGRPVQVTNDLRSFWTRGYPEVRRELRARYPRHPWPDDPWTATPTSRPLRRRPQ